jgi:hypothetical protein
VEKLAIVIGVAVAVAIVLFLRDRRAAPARRMRSAAVGLAMTAVVAAAAVYGFAAVRENEAETESIDQAMADTRALPMVRLVLDDVPGSEDRLRTALKEELRQPTMEGLSRPIKLMRELRAVYVVPALKAADDASAAAAIDARIALLRHLRDTDLVVCKEFAVTGLQRTDRLDTKGQALFRNLLSALENAYRSGRAAKPGAQPAVASDSGARALLRDAGFVKDDFDKLKQLTQLSDAEACDIALKFNDAPQKLPPDKRAELTRYLLTMQ